MAQPDSRTTGHVKLSRRVRAEVHGKYRANGEQTTRLIGPAWLKRGRAPEGFFTRPMAEVELHRMMEAADRDALADSGVTFQRACDEWLGYLEQEKRVASTTLRHNRSAVAARLVPFFGADAPIIDISTERIDAYRVHSLVERELSPSTVQRDLTNLSGIFRRAVRMKWIAASPTTTPSASVSSPPATSTSWPSSRSRPSRGRLRAPRTPLCTGSPRSPVCGRGELRALCWRHVDFASATVHVRRNLPAQGRRRHPKSGGVRSVPLIDQAARALDGCRSGAPHCPR